MNRDLTVIPVSRDPAGEPFTEDPIKYTIPAKDFYKIVNDLRNRIEALECAVMDIQSQK